MKKSRKTVSVLLTILMSLACINFAFADSTYTVKYGDTLGKIALKYGVTYQEIAKVNKIANVNRINVGQKLVIPSKTTVTAVKQTASAKVDTTGIKGTKLRIATTTSTNDTGLLDVLVPPFDKKYGTKTD